MYKEKEVFIIILEKNDYKHIETENIEDWTNLIDKCIRTKKYNIITFLINDRFDDVGFYSKLKYYTNEQKSVVTQFIKKKTLKKKCFIFC